MLNFLLITANIVFLFVVGVIISVLTVGVLEQFWGNDDRSKGNDNDE